MWVLSLGWEDPLEEDVETHSSILAWRIPGTGEPCGLPSMGSQESDTTEATQQQQHAFTHLVLSTHPVRYPTVYR